MSSSLTYFSSLGVAIALASLSAILLASYICCRRRCPIVSSSSAADGVIHPRIIFEDEDDLVLGLDQGVINSYPKFTYCRSSGNGNGATTCAICLCEYKESEMLRMMPECRHYFHLCCIDPWLRLSGSCPVCRNSPLPTPLSELVPLSQYQYASGR